MTWYVGPWAQRDDGPPPSAVTRFDPLALTFLGPRGAWWWFAAAGVSLALAFAMLSGPGGGLMGFLVLATMAVGFGLFGADGVRRSRRPAVVVGPGGVWFGPDELSTSAAVLRWQELDVLVFFTAVHDGPRTGSSNRRSSRSGPALGARRVAPPRLPPETQQGVEQLGRFVDQAPHVGAALRAESEQAVMLPHRYVRSSALQSREQLTAAVNGWAPHVRVTMGDRVDFRGRSLMLPALRDAYDGVRDSLRRPPA
ncbi:hypothetical protein [Phycicoccus ginsengisoli]